MACRGRTEGNGSRAFVIGQCRHAIEGIQRLPKGVVDHLDFPVGQGRAASCSGGMRTMAWGSSVPLCRAVEEMRDMYANEIALAVHAGKEPLPLQAES